MGHRGCDPQLDAGRGTADPGGQRAADQANPFSQSVGPGQLRQRPPRRLWVRTRAMGLDGEEGAQRRQVAQDARYDVAPAGSRSGSSACGAGMAGCRNRSSKVPKTSAIVVQMSTWFRTEYQRNFHNTSALKPG